MSWQTELGSVTDYMGSGLRNQIKKNQVLLIRVYYILLRSYSDYSYLLWITSMIYNAHMVSKSLIVYWLTPDSFFLSLSLLNFPP